MEINEMMLIMFPPFMELQCVYANMYVGIQYTRLYNTSYTNELNGIYSSAFRGPNDKKWGIVNSSIEIFRGHSTIFRSFLCSVPYTQIIENWLYFTITTFFQLKRFVVRTTPMVLILWWGGVSIFSWCWRGVRRERGGGGEEGEKEEKSSIPGNCPMGRRSMEGRGRVGASTSAWCFPGCSGRPWGFEAGWGPGTDTWPSSRSASESGRSTWGSRPRSSCRPRCRTPRSSWAQRRASPADA